MYFHEEVPGLKISFQMATGYTIIVAIIVSIAAMIYLKVSGAFDSSEEAAQ